MLFGFVTELPYDSCLFAYIRVCRLDECDALLLHYGELQAWLQALERYYADRVLPVDLETSHTGGELTAAAQRADKIVPASDGLIAATARRHGLHVMTRNTEHFILNALSGVAYGTESLVSPLLVVPNLSLAHTPGPNCNHTYDCVK